MDEWRELIQLPTSARSNGRSKMASNSSLKLAGMDGHHHGILGVPGVLINLRSLNNVFVNLKEGYTIIETGALVHEVINAAYDAKAHIGMSV